MKVSKKLLQDIINEFAKEEKVFTNESQFQFELGLALQKKFDSEKKNYKVLFEVLSFKGDINNYIKLSKKEKKKQYTDIVVDMGEKGVIVIELKYKIASPTDVNAFKYNSCGSDYYTFAQGAYDTGTYDFWQDVIRNEQLVSGAIQYNFSNKKVVKGFAVIMTNDYNYQKNHNGMFKNFFLENNKVFSAPIKWCDKDGNEDDSYRGVDNAYKGNKGVDIKGSYTAQWKNYNLSKNTTCYEIPAKSKSNVYDNYKFKYLILEIPPKP